MRQHSSPLDASAARQRLRAIHERMGALLEVLFRREPMFAAYVHLARRRCGNVGCHCVKGDRHPLWVMTYQEGTRKVNRAVPQDERETLIAQATQYRAFRRACQEWRRLSAEAAKLFQVLLASREIKRPTKEPREKRG